MREKENEGTLCVDAKSLFHQIKAAAKHMRSRVRVNIGHKESQPCVQFKSN